MTAILSDGLIQRLRSCMDLPSPPTVAARILELSENPVSDIDTLADVVSYDPALSAKILAIANSSMFMRRTKIESLKQAVVMFGWMGTLNIALSCSMIGSVHYQTHSGIDHEYFWRRVLVAAVATRSLGGLMNLKNQHQLFLAALLQDIGILAIERLKLGVYDEIFENQHDHEWLQSKEVVDLGASHAEVGAWLLSHWNLSSHICRLVATSHHLEGVESVSNEERMERACVVLGSQLADLICAEDVEIDHFELANAFATHLDIHATELVNLVIEVARHFEEISTLFGIDPAETVRFESASYVLHKVLVDGGHHKTASR